MTEQEWKNDFARRLQVLSYQKKGYNKKELAEASGLSTKTIGRYRQGKRIPDAISLSKIAKALDCDIADLIPTDEITK